MFSALRIEFYQKASVVPCLSDIIQTQLKMSVYQMYNFICPYCEISEVTAYEPIPKGWI